MRHRRAAGTPRRCSSLRRGRRERAFGLLVAQGGGGSLAGMCHSHSHTRAGSEEWRICADMQLQQLMGVLEMVEDESALEAIASMWTAAMCRRFLECRRCRQHHRVARTQRRRSSLRRGRA